MNWRQNLLDKARALLSWTRAQLAFAWTHRTATIGSIGVAAGGIENFLATHRDVVLPKHLHGLLVGALGGIVAAVGIYNSVSEYLKREP